VNEVVSSAIDDSIDRVTEHVPFIFDFGDPTTGDGESAPLLVYHGIRRTEVSNAKLVGNGLLQSGREADMYTDECLPRS